MRSMPRMLMEWFPSVGPSVCPRKRPLVQTQVEALLVLVLKDTKPPLFHADAALLDARERGRDREQLVGVDPHRPGLERAREAPGALVVARPDAGGEPEHAVVRLPEEVGLVAVGHRHQ